jgi:hypothetical protein
MRTVMQHRANAMKSRTVVGTSIELSFGDSSANTACIEQIVFKSNEHRYAIRFAFGGTAACSG